MDNDKDWELCKKLANAHNASHDDEVIGIITNNIDNGSFRFLLLSLSCFDITVANIRKYKDLAQKLVNKIKPYTKEQKLSLSDAFRLAFIETTLEELVEK